MSDPFVAEIRIFGCNFAPNGWAFCNGQVMSISQNTALFSLLGTTYGGDGRSTFALPNLQGSAPIQQGQGPGLSDYILGETSGSDTVTLIHSEMPSHGHNLGAQGIPLGSSASATGNVFSRPASGNLYHAGSSDVQLAGQTIAPAGGSQPHNNLQPYLTLNFCIALQGIYPARS